MAEKRVTSPRAICVRYAYRRGKTRRNTTKTTNNDPHSASPVRSEANAESVPLVDRHDVQAHTTAASRYRPKEHQTATLKRPLAEKSGDFSKSAMGRDETAWAGRDQV